MKRDEKILKAIPELREFLSTNGITNRVTKIRFGAVPYSDVDNDTVNIWGSLCSSGHNIDYTILCPNGIIVSVKGYTNDRYYDGDDLNIIIDKYN